MQAAPFYDDVADAPPGGTARWATAADGTRLRLAFWRPGATTPPRGTVLLFPGRTEYIEKYGKIAGFFTRNGFALLCIDWRGQGLSDRALAEPRLGHVGHFNEYQHDVAAALHLADSEDLPRPLVLVAHSMGGCIGLRALHQGLPVAAAAFSGPMWGINLAASEIPVAWGTSLTAAFVGRSHRLTPQTGIDHQVVAGTFEGNDLTTNREMWDYMKAQTDAHPALALGGPTLGWLRAALLETTRLSRLPPPDIPAVTMLGSNDRIVSPSAVRRLMARWPAGRLEIAEGAEHEIMMEQAKARDGFLAAARELFCAQG